jgi:hypothetical protein
MLLNKYIKILLIALLFLPFRSFAQDSPINISGSIQTGYKLYDNYSFAPYFDKDMSQDFSSVARIIIESDSHNVYSYELHAVQAYNYSDVYTGVTSRDTSMLSVGLENNWTDKTDIDQAAYYYFDRANIKFAVQDLDIHFGRLAVSFGKPIFWNLFDYYGESYLNQEYKAGIDALRLDKAITNFSGVNIVINKQKILTQSGNYLENNAVQSYQRLGSKEEMGLLLRGYTTVKDTDYALLYKKEPEGHRIGIEVDGEIGSVNFYDEMTYLWGTEKISMPGSYQGNLLKNYLMNVLGINYRFNNNLQITAEHLFNGIGDSSNLDASNIRYKNGLSTSLNNHLSGVSLSYEFNPLVVGRYDSKLAWADFSQQHNFSFIRSITDNVDFIAGGQINAGDRPNGSNWQNPNIQSEFGRLSNSFYFELKCYF